MDDGCNSMTSEGRLWLCNTLSVQSGKFLDLVTDNIGTILLLVAFLLFSAYFSSAETAVTAISRVRIKAMADSGNKRAKIANRLINNFEKTFTTILVGNNIVNIALASFATVLALRLNIDEAVMTAIITVVVIIFGEIIPKALSKMLGERFTLDISPSLSVISFILTPVSLLFTLLSKLLTRLFAKREEPSVTEDDVIDIIEDMEEEGALDSDESRLLYSAFEFGDVSVNDIFTERRDMIYINMDMSNEEILETVKNSAYSRLPVCKGDLDNTVGIIHTRDYLEEYIKGNTPDVWELMMEPFFTSPETKIEDLLSSTKRLKKSLALVRSRSGRVLGVVTLEDMLEELVGEIWDENDKIEEKFREIGENTFEVSADISVVSAFEMMDYDDYDRDECGHYTLRKWVGRILKRVPTPNTEFSYRRLDIKVNKVFRGRLISLIFTVNEPEIREDSEEATEV
ncbi:MAG: HlyC/CorC family transporter [Clostridia bacterium]|nr:HlyC/CorC family transporter [Clostridia bacterium]